jgi:hypothetical protein
MHCHCQVIDQNWQRPVAKHPAVIGSNQLFDVGDHIVKRLETKSSTTFHPSGIH